MGYLIVTSFSLNSFFFIHSFFSGRLFLWLQSWFFQCLSNVCTRCSPRVCKQRKGTATSAGLRLRKIFGNAGGLRQRTPPPKEVWASVPGGTSIWLFSWLHGTPTGFSSYISFNLCACFALAGCSLAYFLQRLMSMTHLQMVTLKCQSFFFWCFFVASPVGLPARGYQSQTTVPR